MVRTFVAVDIPENLKEKIRDLQKNFNIKGIKLTEPENLHWTVKFLGEISEEDAKTVIKILEKIKQKPFKIDLGGVGAFPSESYVRIIWVGVGRGEEEFILFLNKIKEALKDIGKKDNYETRPHLTIGRVKFIQDKEVLKKKLDGLKGAEIGKMSVDKMVLYQSLLTRNGPIYTKIKEFNLV